MNNYLKYLFKILFFLFLSAALGNAYGQSLALQSKSDRATNQDDKEALSNALLEIGKKHQVRFSFDKEVVENRFVEKGKLPDATLEDALNSLLKPFQLDYKKIDDVHYVIIRGNNKGDKIKKVSKESLQEASLEHRLNGNNFLYQSIPPGRVKQNLEQTISGTVTDEESGEPLPGVNVLAKGTTTGTVTGIDGKYRLTVDDDIETVVFSSIGYLSQEVAINGRSTINVVLTTDIKSLSEVVVIGYGTQIESRVTGSIARADPEDMARVSTPTVGQALQGRVPGVFIKNQNGQPGQNKTAINIRGFGEPLYIVDGLPVDEAVFSNLNPNDIAELNVLKDAASAAVYGARAGNGVVLVTTKRGTAGDIQFSYRGDVGLQGLTMVPDAIDSWEYMALFNMRNLDQGIGLRWSPATVADFRAHNDGSDPENFPSVDMFELIPRKTAPMITHDLSLRGGSERVRYFISGNMFDQTGLERNVFGDTDTKFKRYNIRGNVDVNVSEKFDFNLDMSYNLQNFYGPRNAFEGTNWSQGQGIFARSGRWRPFHSIEELPGGHLEFPRGAPEGQTVNPLNLASADIGGSQEFQRGFIDFKLGGKYQLLPGLSTSATINYQGTNLQEKMFQKRGPEYRYNADTEQHEFVRALNADTRVERRNSQTENINFQYFLNGDFSFGEDHTLTSMYVFEFIQQDFERIDASRILYEFPIAQLSAGPPSQQFNNDVISRNKRMGHIGRISYNYADKYSLEVSARYDGSMRFPEDSRWGFFPSVSGAWNVTEESFMQDIGALNFLTFLKLRGSWGRLGFDAAGDFQFLSTFSFDDFYIFQDKTLRRTISTDGLPNPNITWEKMDIINFGLDASFWEGKLEATFDVFRRHRFDVLGQRILEVPPVVGAVLPQQNFQEFENQGLELSLQHSNTINSNWNYSIGGNFGIYEEIVEHTDEPDFINKEVERREKQIGRRVITGGRNNVDIFYLETDGLFTSQEEIDNWADIDGSGNRSIQIGDARVIDRNGDGRITDADKYIATSGTQPRMTFGFQTRVSWKGLELVSFWQGASRFGWNLTWSEFEAPFPSNGVALQKDINDAYIPENEFGLPTVSAAAARWPRASGRFDNDYDMFLIDGSYLRLKQLQLGYTLPTNLIDMIGLRRVKVYAGGTNLLTFSDLDFLDPEIDEDPAQFFGNYHPQTRVINFGIEIDF
ncbi:TonB-linked SusC/RagA family outer membrane protein [Catalinimonas alkaloidigena]|uniref:SusC/RagA family TonB-linked outer membrane protein n=1 Tax=Catalinimonas alkaloidigena TaxID=1075417 RepID=UPI0024065FD7|nr:SusC/RagA family TonB-linked outer membrane protein [Catalinimonas alkaloidigena]MDF9798858.1 TonB-linked SusC/RagA family outer membrane protein [Catalinimonas alkaloidigena]